VIHGIEKKFDFHTFIFFTFDGAVTLTFDP